MRAAAPLFLSIGLSIGAAGAVNAKPSPPADPDGDRDGLSDFQETHKYRTDPTKADSDGDGKPDGDWDERREFTYSIRCLVSHMPPAEAVSDDWQDARLLDRTDDAVELEIVAYPLSTADRDIPDDREWRARAKDFARFTEPNLTCDFDDALTKELVESLKKDGIDPGALGGRTLVERVSTWTFSTSRDASMGFTICAVTAKDGRLAIAEGLEEYFQRGCATREPVRTVEEQFDAETRGRAMLRARIHGSCTSSAVYLQTVLRALGVPTRTTVAMPAADGNDEREVERVREGLRPSAIRDDVVAGAERSRGWTEHTFNVVRVGGRWRRLNYGTLGQPMVDRDYLGLMLRILDYDDRATAGTAETWGRKFALGTTSARFPNGNPYRVLSIADRMGPHATVVLPPAKPKPVPREHGTLTITKASWVTDFPQAKDLVELAVSEWFDDQDGDQYKRFTDACDRRFVLRAEGVPDVVVETGVGSITDGGGRHSVALHVPRSNLREGIAYRVVPLNDCERLRWVVAEGVTITR